MKYHISQGDNRETLRTLPDNSIDAVVTDPPYGIDFLGKDWDANTGAVETYAECLRVLKPGGHLVAFSAARTYHHLAVTLEAAGFEIRDQIMWIYSSGFPKSQDVGKSIQRSTKTQDTNEWTGWGTALKPAHEPIALARKPLGKGLSIARNCQTWGVGALNIDATRVPYVDNKDMEAAGLNWNKTGYETGGPRFVGSGDENNQVEKPIEKKDNINSKGRFPSNVLGEIAEPYQKYFYCPKVSRKERHIGFEDPGAMFPGSRFDVYMPTAGKTNPETTIKAVEEKLKNKGNNHPTVKPIELMKYLIKLVTPPGGTVLDPFTGSGSTGCAAVELGYDFIGCELDPAYVDIANRRIQAWLTRARPTTYHNLFGVG